MCQLTYENAPIYRRLHERVTTNVHWARKLSKILIKFLLNVQLLTAAVHFLDRE